MPLWGHYYDETASVSYKISTVKYSFSSIHVPIFSHNLSPELSQQIVYGLGLRIIEAYTVSFAQHFFPPIIYHNIPLL